MSRYAAFVLFLAIGLGFSHAAATDDPFTSDPSEELISGSTTSALTTTKPTTTSSTEPPKTTTTDSPTTTSKAETTTTTTTESPTTTTTKAPTTTTKAETTTKTTTVSPTTTTTKDPTTTTKAETTTKTTEAPTTTATTAPPTTTSDSNTTSTAPNITTTAATTTTPAPTTPPPPPETHLYKILDAKDTTCLMVQFGLRIGYTGDKYEEINFEFTNKTSVNGSCGEDSSELVLQSDPLTITFTFLNDTKKFSLHALNVTGKTSSGVAFSQANTNMTLWQAALGSSYMCKKEQNYNITDLLKIFTFELQVQPFGITKDSFSTAQECSMDDTSILIPIVVGAALAGLILIVVIAYVIGRRKTYVGYQTL